MPGKLKTATLGCKVNQYETQWLQEGLCRAGFEEALPGEAADLCVVNTCTVTAEGDAKSRQTIRRLNRENPAARIVVMGCYATRAPEQLAALPGVVEVLTDKRELPDLMGRFGVIDIPHGISGLAHRHRAYVKVQDGCLLNCTYCIIPRVRPVMVSRPAPEIVDEIARLVSNGYREVVLTGIHLGHYGVDFNRGKPKRDWIRLSHLLDQICSLTGEFRVRLSSIEATEVTHELLEVMRKHGERVCPHLHVCLQSGSDRILQRMKRRWSRRHIIERCRQVAETLDRPAFTTDVIVGFPGETEEDFAETLEACRQIGFSKIHVFPFSPRRDTPAAEMPDQIPKQVKSIRAEKLAMLETELKRSYLQSLVGSTLQVLVETIDAGRMQVGGTSCRYATVRANSRDAEFFEDLMPLEGQLIGVRCKQFNDRDGTLLASFV